MAAVEAESPKALMRQALSPNVSASESALRLLLTSQRLPPPPFAPHLFVHALSLVSSSSVSLSAALLEKLLPNAPQSLNEKLKSAAANIRAQSPPLRKAVTAVKLSCLIMPHGKFSIASLDLLVAALVAVYTTSVPRSGPQRRSKVAALRVASSCVSSVTMLLCKYAENLFNIADRYAKSPLSAIGAVALLSSCSDSLSVENQSRLLLLVCTICMKVPKYSSQVVQVCHGVLSSAEQSFVITSVVPVIEKALIREPQTAISSASCLLCALKSVDISPVALKSVLPSILQAAKSSDLALRMNAVDLIHALAERVGDESTMLKVVKELVSSLKVSRYIYQRIAVFDSLTSCVTESSPFGSVSDFVLDSVRSWLAAKKEMKEDAILSALRCLFRVLVRTLDTLNPHSEGSSSVKSCSSFLSNVLCGKATESDQRALLSVMTESHVMKQIPESFFDTSVPIHLADLIESCASKPNKVDIALHVATLFCDWSFLASSGNPSTNTLPEKVSVVLGHPAFSPVLSSPKSFSTISDCLCAVRSCFWMVLTGHEAKERAIACLYRHCIDNRPEVSRYAQDFIRSSSDVSLRSRMFLVLWCTQFSGAASRESVAKNYTFDDGMIAAERLGHALLSTVLPTIVPENIPLIVLASNHPRLCPDCPQGRLPGRSRFWVAIERVLGAVDSDLSATEVGDWLDKCLDGIFGTNGLRSSDSVAAQSAINSLAALARECNSYSPRVLRRSVLLLRSIALETANLPDNAFEALRIVTEADAAHARSSSENEVASSTHKTSKKSNASRKSTQEKQAQADRARAAAANASAMAEKVAKARDVAETTQAALRNSQHALDAITAIVSVAPSTAHTLMSGFLPLLLPLIKYEVLDRSCRAALYALTKTVSSRLSSLAIDISTCLYALERDIAADHLVSSIVGKLKTEVPPALNAEDFALISPILSACLLRNPDSEASGADSSRQSASRRREAVNLVKSAAQILSEHCKPESVDAAVTAASLKAGYWAIAVLEREDGAFAAAADVLAFLTETALTPGSESLEQVIDGIFSGKSSVRDATLAALSRLPPLSSPNIGCPRHSSLGRALWFARFDPDEANGEAAEDLWSNYGHPLFVLEDAPILVKLLGHQESDIRVMASKAVAHALIGEENNAVRMRCVKDTFEAYVESCPSPVDEETAKIGVKRGGTLSLKRGKDQGKGMGGSDDVEDEKWPLREGVALFLEQLAVIKALAPADIKVIFEFLAKKGLGDQHDTVRSRMSKAAVSVVETAGSFGPSTLLPMIEKQLNTEPSSGMTKDEIVHADRTRENLVMCLGAVASFLPPEDPRISSIADQVVKSAIETPSEMVQNAAARCLVPLAHAAIKGDREISLTSSLLSKVWTQEYSYGQRRGSAYALAGISAGLGLRFFHRSLLISQISQAVEEKVPSRRQGAFLLIETCATLMGRIFEPYVVTIVPHLLSCMSDPAVDVRNACWAAAQAAMSELSSQGVKLVLPSLVDGLKDRQWRTRAGSAEVLGAMAYCAPRQLALCLPQVVPKLAEALADAHTNVVSSAEAAINRIAAVVRSPEVRKLSPFLLAALRDPAGRTRGAVDAMLGSEFVHAIDAASLALLIPPLQRGLRDRSSELKKRSAAIVGSMCNNVSNNTDVVPYLDLLLPALRVTLLDAIPDVRRTSARAIGALAVSLGEKGLPDLVPWLIGAILGSVRPCDASETTNKAHTATVSSSAERSGAAMGLAEVAASMSEKRLEDVLSRVLTAGLSSAEAREGGLMLIAYLPRALGERFEGRIGASLSAILQGLADDADIVREAALEAGRNLVSAYAKTSLEHLLPELLQAMREKLWRIRQAATRLLGDMLLVIAGARPERPDIFGGADSAGNYPELDEEKDEDNEEDEEGEDGEDGEDGDSNEFESPEDAAAAMTVEAAMNAIEDVLGMNRRNEVFAALYIARCDVSTRVRQTAMQVWKSVVSNTPRVLREIMPSAVRQIVDALGDEDEERRGAAGKTLGDLAQKLGDRVVPEVLPALRSGITTKTNSDRIRRGACEGLGELVFACPKHQLDTYATDLIDAVYQGLSDELAFVRTAAAEVFASLLKPLGPTTVDIIVPKLIQVFSREDGDSSEAEIALDGLKQILTSCGTRLTAIVVPRLLEERPLNVATCKVLGTAANVAESSFEPYIVDVAEAIVDSMESIEAIEQEGPLEGVLSAMASCGSTCVKLFMDEVIAKYNEGYAGRRAAASRVFGGFCRAAEREHVVTASVTLLDILIRQLADTDEDAAGCAWKSLKDLSDVVGGADLSQHIPVIREALRAASSGVMDSTEVVLLGLQVPKSTAPFVPIVTEGLLHGAPELKEQAALCIVELVELTSIKSLGPFVIKLTGPLIRSLSGRVPWQVKAVVLKALQVLIKKGSMMLRSFVPQLQSSFVKSLSDPHRLVRVRGCAGLASVIPLQSRLEPLLTDVVGLALNGATSASRETGLRACAQVFKLGKKLPEGCFAKFSGQISTGLTDEDADVRRWSGLCLGTLSTRAKESEDYGQVLNVVHAQLKNEDLELVERVSILRGMGAVLLAGRDLDFLKYEDIEESVEVVLEATNSSIAQMQGAACETVGEAVMVMWTLLSKGGESSVLREQWRQHVMRLAEMSEDGKEANVRMAALHAMKHIVEVDDEALQICAEGIVIGVGATNTGIREAAERTLRRAVVARGKDAEVKWERVQICKEMLSEEDGQFLERKIVKLRQMADSDADEYIV